MGITRFPHGIQAFPNIGGGSFGMADSSTVYFVDKNNGNDSYDGFSPGSAFKTVGKAVGTTGVAGKMGAYDVCYIMPGGGTDEASAYQEVDYNLLVPYANTGSAIIGVGPAGLTGWPVDPQIKGEATDQTTAVLQVNASFVAIENLAFNRGFSTTGGIYAADPVASTNNAYGLSVYNCHFRNVRGSTAGAGAGAAVWIVGTWCVSIDKCFFYNTRHGIGVISAVNTTVNTRITNCQFWSDTIAGPDANISCDIYIYCQGSNSFLIDNCQFAHDVPGYSGGTGRYIQVSSGCGLVSNCAMNSTAATLTVGASGTGMRGPTATVSFANVYDGNTNALAAIA